MRARFVCILGTGRTGSSHLIQLLQNCSELNVKGELFHIRSMARLTASDQAKLREESKGEIADAKTLCEWRRRHPRRTLDALYENGNRRPLVFKLFQGHLAKEAVAGDILSRPDIGYILLHRRPIDSYISRMKAGAVRRHEKIDTTAIKPELEPKRFIYWARPLKEWYEWLENEINRRALPCYPICFERHIENRTAVETFSELHKRLEALGCPLAPIARKMQGYERQDGEPDFRNRVANWPEFEAELCSRAPDLLAWALETV
jgi:hypothetical protein